MEVTVNEQSPVEKTVEITIPAEEVDREVARRLRQIGQRAKVPGFRKGKVPMRQLERLHGRAARGEAVQGLVQQALYRALDREELVGTVHVSPPNVTSGFSSGAPLAFQFTAERFPEFEPTGYEGIEAERLSVEVGDEEIDAQLERMREQAVQIVPVEDREIVEEGDVVVISYRARGEGAVEQIFADDQEIWLGDEQLPEGLAAGIVGATRDADTEVKIQLPEGFSIEELSGEEVTLDLQVSAIKKRELPELDDAFAAEVSDDETLEALRARIREDLQSSRGRQAEQQSWQRLRKALLEANPVTMPPLYVREQARQEARGRLGELEKQGLKIADLGINPDDFAQRLEGEVRDSIHEALLLRRVAEKEGVEVTDADIDAWFAKMAGETGMPLARIKAQFAGERARQELEGRLVMEKTRDLIWEKASVTEVDELTPEPGDAEGVEPGDEAAAEAAADAPEGEDSAGS